MGFTIPTAEVGSSISHLTSLLAGASLSPAEDKHGIDHGSDYAKSLGFDLEMDWPEEEIEVSKKKKKNKKKVSPPSLWLTPFTPPPPPSPPLRRRTRRRGT
jgi:hypothetical protein